MDNDIHRLDGIDFVSIYPCTRDRIKCLATEIFHRHLAYRLILWFFSITTITTTNKRKRIINRKATSDQCVRMENKTINCGLCFAWWNQLHYLEQMTRFPFSRHVSYMPTLSSCKRCHRFHTMTIHIVETSCFIVVRLCLTRKIRICV
jgi:hypothetical protein